MKKLKKQGKKLLLFLAAVCLTCSFPAAQVQAASPKPYTYTVRILAGNQGTFTGSIRLSVDHRKSGSTSKSKVKTTKNMVTITGLAKDDIITLDNINTDSVKLNAGGKYYVKGIRKSGRDNNEVATSALRVDRDADYVVAYGVQGDMTAYTVNYQDAAGAQVLPSETFYGNVGDKPVVAYKYKEGYEPEVMALTKTLSADESENVFTFVYNQTTREVITRQVGTPGTTTSTVTELIPGAPAPAAPAPAAAAEEGGADAAADEGEDEGADAGAADEGAGEEQAPVQEIGDQEVPLANQDLKDLDEEETPAGDIQLDKVVKKGMPLAASIGIAIAAGAALATLFVMVKKHKNKKGAVVKSE